MLRYLTIFITLATGLTAPASAQYFLQQKDLIFAQAATGPTIETVLTLTNRGDFAYAGVLRFTQGLDAVAWNPLVDGTRITDGQYSVAVDVDEVVTLHISDDALNVGLAVIEANDTYPDNFLEATLTYYVRSGNQITDSVGVAPGQEFYLASLPFENFHDIGLALANAGATGPDQAPTANAAVTLINPQGEVVDTKQIELIPGAQQAQFLYQLFEGTQGIDEMTAGKIEISSVNPVVGTALTQVSSGQISSLPLNPAPAEFSIDMTSDGGDTFSGVMSLWVEGFFVKGYLMIYTHNGVDLQNRLLTLVHGQLIDGFLDLSFFALSQNFFGDAMQDVEMSLYFAVDPFGLESTDVTGNWVLTYVFDEPPTNDTGTLSLSRLSP